MINHHPEQQILRDFVTGQLPASLCSAVSIHADKCSACQIAIANITENHARACFSHDSLAHDQGPIQADDSLAESGFAELFELITSDQTLVEPPAPNVKLTCVNQQTFVLPRALNAMNIGKWSGLGKITRAKIELGEGPLHTHLLYISPLGSVPRHTHKGFELTLLLSGSFSDEMGEYHEGDFMMLDSRHEHQPVTVKGCLCLTVVSDALHFTEGWNQLLNGLGKYVY